MSSKSVERRYAAIKAHSDKWRPASNGYHLIENADMNALIAEIEAMASLGRTEKWKNAIRNWVELINDNSDNVEWAVLQGGIYAAWEAE